MGRNRQEATEHPDQHRSRKDRKPARWRRGLATVTLAAVPLSVTGCASSFGEGSGGGNSSDVSSIYIAGYKVPDDFVVPIMDASRVCSGNITPKILTALTFYESRFNDFDRNNTNRKEVSPMGAEGPTQWMPMYWKNSWGSIWDIYAAEMATARRLCGDIASHGGVSGAVENYNPGDPGYANTVMGYAGQVVLNYGSGNSGGGGSAGGEHQLSDSQKAAKIRGEGWTHVHVNGGEGSAKYGRTCPTVIFSVDKYGTYSVHGVDLHKKDYGKVIWPKGTDPSAADMRKLDRKFCGQY